MSSPDHRGSPIRERTVQDNLDQLLSWGLQDMVDGARPPDQVWPRIEGKLRAGPSPARHRPRRRAWRMAPLAQALAVASLLVVVGLSLGSAFQWLPYFYGAGEPVDVPTRTPAVEQAQANGVPLIGDEGLLSGREMLNLARERARELEVMARDTSPVMDPILKYRHEWHSDQAR